MDTNDASSQFHPAQISAVPADRLGAMISQSLLEGAQVRLKLAEQQTGLIAAAAQQAIECLRRGGKVIWFGNGGSAADAQHLAAEFVCRFTHDRVALPSLALTTDTSALTAVGNDYGYEHVFARQILALGRREDLAIGISTSGNSPNVLRAIKTARQLGIYTIALTGGQGGALASAADLALIVPSACTAYIQECHIAIGHTICGAVDLALKKI